MRMLIIFTYYLYSQKAQRILDLILQFQYMSDFLRKLIILSTYSLWRHQRPGYNYVSQWIDHLTTPWNNPCPWQRIEKSQYCASQRESWFCIWSTQGIKSRKRENPSAHLTKKQFYGYGLSRTLAFMHQYLAIY